MIVPRGRVGERSVALEPEPIGGPPPEWRGDVVFGVALAELEVLGVQHPIGQRGLAPLQPLGPDDIGHHRGLDPDSGWNSGVEVR